MDLFKNLDDFINDKDAHAFLLNDPWGVGIKLI